jgi:tetratricopeptide (TPR) repeat protein
MVRSLSTTAPVRLFVAAVLLVAFADLSTATAAEPSRDEMQRFKKLLATASEQYGNNQYEKALETFREAQDIAAPPTLTYNIARTLEALGRCEKARSKIHEYLDAEGLSEQKRRKGQKRLEKLEQCREPGKLTVGCQPDEADATVKVGERRRACPAEFELDADTYEVRVEAPGYRSIDAEVEVPAGESVRHSVALVETDPPETHSDRGGLFSNGARVAQFGGLFAGAALLTGGLASDLSANGRLRELRTAETAGNAARIRALRNRGQSAKTRTIALYVSGAALTLGSGTWMALDLTGGQKDRDPSQFTLGISPRHLVARWRF